jgi:2-dehydropantoate 2-reductase
MSHSEPAIVVYGPGAIGLGLAVVCRGEGRRVAVCGRAGTLPGGSLTVADERLEAEFEAEVADRAVAVIAVKDYDLEGLMKTYGDGLARATALVALQNGLGSAERLGTHGRVVRAITWARARRASSSEANWGGPLRLAIEMSGRAGERAFAEQVGGLLASRFTRIEMVSTDAFRALQFEKLVVNATTNTLAARYDLACAGLLAHPSALLEAKAIAREIAALAHALGVTLMEDTELLVRRAWMQMGEFEPSMLQDARAGRPLELRSIMDAPLAEAARLGVQMPMLFNLRAALGLQFPTRSSSAL